MTARHLRPPKCQWQHTTLGYPVPVHDTETALDGAHRRPGEPSSAHLSRKMEASPTTSSPRNTALYTSSGCALRPACPSKCVHTARDRDPVGFRQLSGAAAAHTRKSKIVLQRALSFRSAADFALATACRPESCELQILARARTWTDLRCLGARLRNHVRRFEAAQLGSRSQRHFPLCLGKWKLRSSLLDGLVGIDFFFLDVGVPSVSRLGKLPVCPVPPWSRSQIPARVLLDPSITETTSNSIPRILQMSLPRLLGRRMPTAPPLRPPRCSCHRGTISMPPLLPAAQSSF
mmetsp:Transcript_37370/g.89880  ORF Transcript_37370/g.89880 Transcript_37370/m.89880 type:complete len:291 (-) Transcript_37370:68-940(-)